jgi:hypothetical protein
MNTDKALREALNAYLDDEPAETTTEQEVVPEFIKKRKWASCVGDGKKQCEEMTKLNKPLILAQVKAYLSLSNRKIPACSICVGSP